MTEDQKSLEQEKAQNEPEAELNDLEQELTVEQQSEIQGGIGRRRRRGA
ncbi:hypothetical protein ACFFSY_26045 [Paenibacillus aurantiacus]|uniref:YfhD family protein n=1 Tax=Paenibacillus aurantiacus TaxID=1936118 RepID=A0ABV5KWX1_9BACL